MYHLINSNHNKNRCSFNPDAYNGGDLRIDNIPVIPVIPTAPEPESKQKQKKKKRSHQTMSNQNNNVDIDIDNNTNTSPRKKRQKIMEKKKKSKKKKSKKKKSKKKRSNLEKNFEKELEEAKAKMRREMEEEYQQKTAQMRQPMILPIDMSSAPETETEIQSMNVNTPLSQSPPIALRRKRRVAAEKCKAINSKLYGSDNDSTNSFNLSDYNDEETSNPVIITKYTCKTFTIDSTINTTSQMSGLLKANGIKPNLFQSHLTSFKDYYQLKNSDIYVGGHLRRNMIPTIINDRYCSICFKVSKDENVENGKYLCKRCGHWDHKLCLDGILADDEEYICWNCSRS